jgi:hypothetical protein
MNKKKLSKDERIGRLTIFIKVCLLVIVIMFLIIGVQNFLSQRAVALASMSGRMSVQSPEEFCIEYHDRNLTEDGYCDITSVDYDSALWNDALLTEESLYVHYIDCSWGKLIVKNFNPEANSLEDMFRYWYVQCKFNHTERVIIDGEDYR